jgi:shikimate dehydrogenase
MTDADGLSLGLIGYPLGHSLSPRLHAAALHALGRPGQYRLYPLSPGPDLAPALAGLLERMRQVEIDGLNVTIPHKQAVLPLLDECTPAAQVIGAVNTIMYRNGRLIGDNTDAPGFLADLQRAFPGLAKPAEAVVLGAGGAARAVVYALAHAGWQVRVAARRIEQAQALVVSLHANMQDGARGDLCAIALDAAGMANLQRVRLIVNATSAGMVPHVSGDPWPADAPLPCGAAAYDLLYNPP